mmetsp:Transcript_15159/g.38538  ORF Transcript_15159/g.38538 Transcript_15159/m.38538 type:complete len:80 (-) Transcript_15159:784-1023(-)
MHPRVKATKTVYFVVWNDIVYPTNPFKAHGRMANTLETVSAKRLATFITPTSLPFDDRARCRTISHASAAKQNQPIIPC